ncbi:alkaline phosphatase D family protein [Pseudomonas sp. H11T01]|uniref:alkaline phosphatase D family protein n=1 Tax=Pseudomonas sp. H11T01 TaxID=3402749 RepID=UPI003AC60C35
MIKPSVGPIIGHTTAHHSRLFLRAIYSGAPLTFGGIRHRRAGEQTWSQGAFVLLDKQHDMSGIVVLKGLEAATRYEYQAGWFTTADRSETVDTVHDLPLRWPEPVYTFKTCSNNKTRPRAYIIGSCRYLRMTLGIPSAPERGDGIFAAINALVRNPETPVDGMLMVGDQVYVDDLNIVAPDREYKDILQKYQTAFSQPHIRQLMAHVPTYMILDDHEIEDNWPAKASSNDQSLFNNAIRAYELYQCSHSPAHALLPSGQLDRNIPHYWYQFAHGDIEWFVLDTRTRRTLSKEDRRMLDSEQEHALLDWLITSSARVKLVVTSVMFYPDRRNDGGDAWKSFPAQRERILETIRSHTIKNVIFIAGDVHGSMTSQLTHSDDPDFRVHTIVSSPLCNSKLLPYAKADSFILDRPLASLGHGSYNQELTSNVISQDNFARISIDTEHIRVDYYDKYSTLLQSVNIVLQ